MFASSSQQSLSLIDGYPGQFATMTDSLEIAIPRDEIIAAMLEQGEKLVLDHVCLAVALVADAIEAAREGI